MKPITKLKTDLSKRHHDCFHLIDAIEKMVDRNRARKYLKDKQNKLKSAGTPDRDLQAFLLTKVFEKHI
jgi:hypothetical protein